MIRATITPRRSEILALVLASEAGMSIRSVSDALGLGTSTVGEHMRKLRYLKYICPVSKGGPGTLWTSYATGVERIEAARVEADRARRMRHRAQQRAKQLAQFEHGPIRRIVSATGCAPVRTRAPCSVFHQLAAA